MRLEVDQNDNVKTYIVAEIGINHGGSLELCLQMIRAAKDAGCHAIKLQNYKTEQFIGQRSEFYTYTLTDGTEVTERQADMFKRCEIDFGFMQVIKAYCKEIDIGWHSTPMCIDGLDDLIKLDVECLKNGSDCLKNLDLIKAMGRTGLPTAISTGMATVTEIAVAVEAFKSTGNKNLVLLHCTSAYPCPDDQVNIERLATLSKAFGCMVGLSDHSEGISAAILSTAYGSVWYEAHFTLDKKMKGPDHRFSKDPNEMAMIVKSITAAEKQIGEPVLGMTELERQNCKKWFEKPPHENFECAMSLSQDDILPRTFLNSSIDELVRRIKKDLSNLR